MHWALLNFKKFTQVHPSTLISYCVDLMTQPGVIGNLLRVHSILLSMSPIKTLNNTGVIIDS